jgi:SpoVK/Ycf46/Vps4 family AAA+-type ATPase
MATGDQLKALLKSHQDGDEERFYSVAMQMAAHSARLGHIKQAKEIRDLIDASKEKSNSEIGPPVLLSNELAGLLQVSHPDTHCGDMVLDGITRERLLRVVVEQRQKHRLQAFGLNPRRKLLLVGPPGTGKTMTASALAGDLKLPLYSILFDGLITKYLGETASKLRLIFDAIKRSKGVYFIDEFDALGTRRDLPNEVGEIRRVLNSFLQFLEQDNSESLIIAATNSIDLLDRALFRRFDDVIEYRLPEIPQILETLRNHLNSFDSNEVDWMGVADAALGLSFADIVRVAQDAAKESIIREEHLISTNALLKIINERKSSQS